MLGLLGQDPLDFERLLRRLHTHETMSTCTAYKARRRKSTMHHTANFVRQHDVNASTQRILPSGDTVYVLHMRCFLSTRAHRMDVSYHGAKSLQPPTPCSKRNCAVLLLRLSPRIMTASSHYMTASVSVSHPLPHRALQASSGSAHRLSHQPCLHPPSECMHNSM